MFMSGRDGAVRRTITSIERGQNICESFGTRSSLSLFALCYFSSSFSGCRSCKHRRPSPALRCTVYVWLHDCILYKRRGRHCRHLLLHSLPKYRKTPTNHHPTRTERAFVPFPLVRVFSRRASTCIFSLRTPGRQQQLSSTERVQSLFIHCCHPHVYGHFFSYFTRTHISLSIV